MLEQAVELGHQKATEMLAEALLFGSGVEQNVARAREIMEHLANKGSPRGQMVIHFKSV